MGRLTTDVAAAFVKADDLPPRAQRPRISALDALFPDYLVKAPKQVSKEKPLDPAVGGGGVRVRRQFYAVRRDPHGGKVLVNHRAKVVRVGSGSGNGSAKGSAKGVAKGDGSGKKDAGGDGKKDEDGNENGKKDGDGNAKGGSGKKDPDENKNVRVQQQRGGAGDAAASADDKKDEAFTTEEDEKLQELKAADPSRPWADIAQQMGRPLGQVKERFKELKKGGANAEAKPKQNEAGGDGGGKDEDRGGSKDHQQVNDDDNPNKGQKKKKEKQQQQKKNREKEGSNPLSVARAPSSKAPPSAVHVEARFTMDEWMTLQEDSTFGFGELQCLSELLMRDEELKWLRIAGAFFDKTGRRVHPEDIRDKFEGLAGMGGE